MNRFRQLFLLALLLALSASSRRVQAQAKPEAKQDFVVIIPHTHWEGAVFKTREEYLQIGLPHILKALSLMQRYPQYHFVLDHLILTKVLIHID